MEKLFYLLFALFLLISCGETPKIGNYEIDGKVIGKWSENKYTFSNLIIYKNDKKTFIKTVWKDGQTLDKELKETTIENGIRYDYKDSGYSYGEYFILNNQNELELYNGENKKVLQLKLAK
ncbi:hypothetical protein [Empedobacter sp. UBA5039]|uniref:hypothetical protein n=1 Tax=Empedobacter sp. UBA5039 TaxID=1946439 RepID=UPI0025C1F96B|nr:hypothetical protein [Empedobacter sp. UBA5039]